MESYSISNKKEFMSRLLKFDLFDTFEVREVTLHTSYKCFLDGSRNQEFFSDLETDEKLSDFVTWKEIKPFVYNSIMGQKLPTYFKIVLATNPQKTEALSPEASTFFLNIIFKDNEIKCSTAIAYKTFTLDKSCEKDWDDRIKNFLFKYQFM